MRGVHAVRILLLTLAACPAAWAQGVQVIPNCGTTATPFVLFAGGWDVCDCDPCTSGFEVYLDGVNVYGVSGANKCLTGVTVNLHELVLPEGGCATCSLAPGEHEVRVIGTSECGDPDPCFKSKCIRATFQIVAGPLGDPWANDLAVVVGSSGLDSVIVTFAPPSGCGVPECTEVYLEQAVRIVAITGADSICVAVQQLGLSYVAADVEEIAALVTPPPRCTFIDHRPDEKDPYMNGKDRVDTGSFGRSGASPRPSTTGDSPNLRVPPGADKVLGEFEVNAFCGAGPAKGRFMGKTFWVYERLAGATRGAIRRDPRRSADLGQPTPLFLEADALFKDGVGFPSPKPSTKGGSKCPD